MIEPSLPLQAAIRTLIASDANVTALVPANSILDANKRPSVMPAIILGEGQTVPDQGLARDRFEVFLDLHIWAQEAGTTVSKAVISAIRNALFDWRPEATGLAIADLNIQGVRYFRDLNPLYSHSVMTLNTRVRVLPDLNDYWVDEGGNYLVDENGERLTLNGQYLVLGP